MKSIALRQWEAAAYAAGRLTQLRRVVKVPASAKKNSGYEVEIERGGDFETALAVHMPDSSQKIIKAPYGAPSDKLALRETWGIPDGAYPGTAAEYVSYRSDESTWHCHTNDAPLHRKSQCSGYISPAVWNSPVTMPLWAVRWHPVITAVRLERVQDMSEGDAVACGIQSTPLAWHYMHQFNRDNPRTPWESNPWVWVYDVEGVKA